MEEQLLKLFNLADSLNEKQDKVYAHITYIADSNKTLEIVIRSKKDFSYIEKCQFQLNKSTLIKWDSIIRLFENYVGGAADEQKRSC